MGRFKDSLAKAKEISKKVGMASLFVGAVGIMGGMGGVVADAYTAKNIAGMQHAHYSSTGSYLSTLELKEKYAQSMSKSDLFAAKYADLFRGGFESYINIMSAMTGSDERVMIDDSLSTHSAAHGWDSVVSNAELVADIVNSSNQNQDLNN
jgi:hypothetical protein